MRPRPLRARRALVILLVPVLLSALPACGGGGGDGPPTDVRDADEPRDARGDARPGDATAEDAAAEPADAHDGGACGDGCDVGAPVDAARDTGPEDAGDGGPADTHVADAAADAADAGPPCPDACCDDAACDDGDPCTVDRCGDDGACVAAAYDCDDGDPCTVDRCDGAGGCVREDVAGCCPLDALFGAELEVDPPAGLTIEDRARNTRPETYDWDVPVVWAVDTERAHGGRRSLYAGHPDWRTYDNGRHVSTIARTRAVDLPAGLAAELRFWTWMDVEETPGYDALNVVVELDGEPDGDGGAVPVWTRPVGFPPRAWRPVVVNLSAFAGRTVRVGFVFDTVDASTNGFEGVYLDDIAIGTRCERPACAADGDCDDGVACTADTCDGGACAHGWEAGCCQNAIDCHDGDACTTDICAVPDDDAAVDSASGACLNAAVPVEGCCNGDADCDDGDPCTSGRCDGNLCVQVASGEPGCCEKDEDCEDEDPCTEATCGRATGACAVVDRCECHFDVQCRDDDATCTRESCVDGQCLVEPTGQAGCCASEVFVDHFESAATSASRWTFANGQAGVGWTVWDGPASTSGALYYGNPATGTYASGAARNHGTATTAPIRIPPAVETSLSFDLYLAVEAGIDHDTFSFSLIADGEELTILEKDFQTETYTWRHVRADLSGFAGRTVQLRFSFDTEDGEGNDGEGVYVDEFALVSTCRVRACDSDANCYDGFGATAERCVAGACRYRVSEHLCDTDAQCDDGDVCTRDTCDRGGCVFQAIPGCCAAAADCDDGDVCTTDACVGTNPPLCQFERTPGCCTDVADCDDGNPCTEDVCPGEGAFCDNPWIDGCCLASSQCDDGDDCTLDRCAGNACEHVWICCEADGDCDDGDDDCTADACVDGRCVFTLVGDDPACCEAEPLRIDFEDGTAQGFAFAGGTAGSAWRVLSTGQGGEAHDGSHALYFGDASGGFYGDDQAATATSPPIVLPPGQALTLRFRTWIETEDGYDELSAYLDADGRSTLLHTWTGLHAFWQETTVDLSWLAGSEARLRFVFTSDEIYGERGVFVDGIVLESTCAPLACDADADCTSETGCIEGRCVSGGCRYDRRSDCCETAADCDDVNPCTTDRCENDVCTHTEVAGCCRSAADCGDGVGCVIGACVANRCQQQCAPDCAEECCLADEACDDGDPCTVDLCGDDFVCGHLWACCESDADCDDGDDVCTTDRCVDAFCRFEIDATNPDCCRPTPHLLDFEDGTLQGFETTPGAGGDAWQVVSDVVHTGQYALAYRGPGGGYHDNSDGTAESPPLALPAGQQLTLSFWLLVDTEAGYDYVEAELVGETAGMTLGAWDGTRDWQEVTADVSWLAGQSVRLRLAFSSDGSITYPGVWVDDIAVTSACAPLACDGDMDCATPTGCVEGTCAGGACRFEPEPDCCQLDAECDDGNPCTLDRCVANRCEFPGDPADPGCCRSDADCDDGAPCTEDRCVDDHCVRSCPVGCAYAFPYAEDFDSATSLSSSCWTTMSLSGGGTSGWSFVPYSYDMDGPHLLFDASTTSATGAYVQCVRSPAIDASFATTARLSFPHFAWTFDEGFTTSARISADGGATWETVWSDNTFGATSSPTDVDVFSALAGSADVRVALCVAYDGMSWAPWYTWDVDDVRLDGDVYRGEPPVWDTAPGDWLAPIGATTRFPLAGRDPDGDPLAFRLGDDAPAFVSIDTGHAPDDGAADLVVAPPVGTEGAYEVTVLLADPWLETPRTFPVTVTIPGAPPVVADPGPQTVVVDTVLRVTLTATDADGDPLSFTATDLPPFATLRDAGGGTAWLTLSPRIADAGAHELAVVVSDGTQTVPFALAVAVVFPGEAAPLVETFDKDDELAVTGWTTESDPDSAANDWLLLSDADRGGFAPTFLDVPVVAAFADTLRSPPFDARGLGTVRVRFATEFADYGPFVADPPVTLALLASADRGATWTPLWTHAETDGDLPWAVQDVAAPALADVTDGLLAFRIEGATSEALLWWIVDDVIVYGSR